MNFSNRNFLRFGTYIIFLFFQKSRLSKIFVGINKFRELMHFFHNSLVNW